MTDREARARRVRPGKGGVKPLAGPLVIPTLKLAAPSTGSAFNVIRLVTWFELRVVSAHGNPLVGERCQMFTPSGKVVEKKTDANGVVRFDALPILPPEGSNWEDVSSPPVILPDILEEWVDIPPGDFGKHDGLRDDHRKRDGTVHFVPQLETRTEIKVDALSTEQKLQHFIDAHVDNAAYYETASPNAYKDADRRWNWGKGSVCNQHINFFLGYMYNYNDHFTTRGSATAMTALPMFDSDKHKLGTVTHRGYLEFLKPITGYGSALGTAYDPEDDTTWPTEARWNKAYTYFEYVRIARYFDHATGSPTDDGKKLIDSLGPINVYSVSDIKKAKVADAEVLIRAWLRKHRSTKAGGDTDAQIAARTSASLWELVFDLDDDDAEDRKLIASLKDKVTWDHHAGILLVRAVGGGPVTPTTTDKELWTFSADGASTPGPLIVRKKFADDDLRRRFLHIGIWRLKELKGGFAPLDTKDNAGGISVDLPPRFIHWG